MSTVPFRQPNSENDYLHYSHRHLHKNELTEAQHQLLARYYIYVRQTGDYHFEPLVSQAYSTHIVSNAKAGEYLLPRKIKSLCSQIDKTNSNLKDDSQELRIVLDNFSDTLIKGSHSVREYRDLSHQISNCLLLLHSGCETLFDLTQKYGPSEDTWFQRLRRFASDIELDEVKAHLRYHSNSLQYILRFLDTHSHLDTISLEYSYIDWNIYAERLQGYCNDIPVHGENLGCRLKKLICDKAPDNQFSKDIEID